MKHVVLLVLCVVARTATAQDTSFSRLRLSGAMFVPAATGRIAEDWNAKPGVQVAAASNVGRSELAFSVGHVRFEPITPKPSFGETFLSLTLSASLWQRSRGGFSVGARLTDIRMDFDDPGLIGGLRTEEETMLAGVARAHADLGRRIAAFTEISYGAALHSTRTPLLFAAAGLQRDVAMPGWLRGILR